MRAFTYESGYFVLPVYIMVGNVRNGTNYGTVFLYNILLILSV